MAGWKEERDIEVSTDLIGLIRKINTDSSAQRPDNSVTQREQNQMDENTKGRASEMERQQTPRGG